MIRFLIDECVSVDLDTAIEYWNLEENPKLDVVRVGDLVELPKGTSDQ